jgi:hypothetical protein
MRSIKYLSNMGAALALMFLIASCSTIKNMRKERDKTKEQTESKVEETSKSKTVEDLKAKSLTTIEVDTAVTIKGKTESGSTPLTDGEASIPLSDGGTLVLRQDKGRDGYVKWNVTRPDVVIPVKVKKTVYTEEDKKTTTTVKKDSLAKVDTAKETDRTLKTKEVKRNGLPWWIWLIIALVILGVIAWRYLKDYINDKIDGIL